MDEVVRFEIPTDDLSSQGLLGVDLRMDPADDGRDGSHDRDDDRRRRAGADADRAGAIDGGIMKRSSDTPSPVLTIGVTDTAQARARTVRGHGP